tara:strand:+ start:1409 stop:1618 length:210 start_codon:yes stop_codon:yes gene_type:complete
MDAVKKAQSLQRALRRIHELAYYDMTVYEDRETGERRRIPNKTRLALGLPTAFELAEASPGSPILEESA